MMMVRSKKPSKRHVHGRTRPKRWWTCNFGTLFLTVFNPMSGIVIRALIKEASFSRRTRQLHTQINNGYRIRARQLVGHIVYSVKGTEASKVDSISEGNGKVFRCHRVILRYFLTRAIA